MKITDVTGTLELKYIERFWFFIESLERKKEYYKNLSEREWFDLRVWREARECGTVGCAVGHGLNYPYFHDRGWVIHNNTLSFHDNEWGILDVNEGACVFFGITSREFDFLFMPSSYEGSPVRFDNVLRRIKAFVNRKTRA